MEASLHFNLKFSSSDTKQRKQFHCINNCGFFGQLLVMFTNFRFTTIRGICLLSKEVSLLGLIGKMWINWAYYKLKTHRVALDCPIFAIYSSNNCTFMISFSVCQSSSPFSALKFRADQSLAKFSLTIRDSFKIHKLKKLDSVNWTFSTSVESAMRVQYWASMTYVICLWRKDRIRFPWIFCKTAAIGAVSIEIQSKRIVIFFRRKPTRKLARQNKTKR